MVNYRGVKRAYWKLRTNVYSWARYIPCLNNLGDEIEKLKKEDVELVNIWMGAREDLKNGYNEETSANTLKLLRGIEMRIKWDLKQEVKSKNKLERNKKGL